MTRPCQTCDGSGRGRDAHGGLTWDLTCPDCRGRGHRPWWMRLGPVLAMNVLALALPWAAALVWWALR